MVTVDCDSKTIRKVMNIIENIQDETPFTASGFFNVDRSTLTAIAGATLTYLIILVQFDDGKSGQNPLFWNYYICLVFFLCKFNFFINNVKLRLQYCCIFIFINVSVYNYAHTFYKFIMCLTTIHMLQVSLIFTISHI